MAQNVVVNGVTYQNCPEVDIPKSGGGTAKFYDTSGADMVAADLRNGKKGFGPNGEVTGGMTEKSAASYKPSTSDQTIQGSQYLAGAQTIKAVTLTNLLAQYIAQGITVKVGCDKIGNSDMSTNFKTDYTHTIEKGDYVIREDGMLYMLNWNITLHANNQATQSTECNAIVDITRMFPDETDEKGILIQEGGRRPIAAGLPISHQEYAGRPDYSGASGQAGMHPDHLITVSCQWNPTTRKIRLDDEFVLGDFTYRIMNVSLAEVQIDRDYGILTLNAKRVAGGSVNGNE